VVNLFGGEPSEALTFDLVVFELRLKSTIHVKLQSELKYVSPRLRFHFYDGFGRRTELSVELCLDEFPLLPNLASTACFGCSPRQVLPPNRTPIPRMDWRIERALAE